MFYTYVLKSRRDGSHYIGHTKDLDARLRRHNAGHSRYTKSKVPYKIIYSEVFSTRSEAMQREKEIKSYKGGTTFKRLFSNMRR